MMVHVIEDEDLGIVDGILRNDSQTIKDIYCDYFGLIKSMVDRFQYLNMAPEDVFQEGLTRAVMNIRRGSFKGDGSFSSYLYGICRNICLKEYNRSKGRIKTDLRDIPEVIEDDRYDAIQLLLKTKEKLDPLCVKIIDLRFGIGYEERMRFDAIAEELNISAENARQRFGRCLSKLKGYFDSTGLMNQLMD